MDLKIYEAELTDDILAKLIRLSGEWEAEGSCRGYRKNEESDIAGNRIFLAEDGGEVKGYLFGHNEKAGNMSSVMPEGTVYFEVEEIYVSPGCRSRGIGRSLFCHAEHAVSDEAEFMLLSTASKNFRAALHFYIDELGMEFWSARLFKRIPDIRRDNEK